MSRAVQFMLVCGLCIGLPASAETLYTLCSIDVLDESVGAYTAVGHVEFELFDDVVSDSILGVMRVISTDGQVENQEWFEVYQGDAGSPPFIPPSFGVNDFEYQFTFGLDPQGGCAHGELWTQSLRGLQGFTTSQNTCWRARACHLTVAVINGGFAEGGDPNGTYSCSDCVILVASPEDGFQFDGWWGDVTSTSPVIIVCLAGSDKSETAYFSKLPCDPDTDPACPCNPDADPYCQSGEPVPCDNCVPGQPPPPNSPILVNFDLGPYRLSGVTDPVFFDIAASGTPVRIGWTAPNADEAFLCLDRNANGRIDDGGELFGTATRLKSGSRAPNGFAALVEYDDNRDGVIDQYDVVWSQLLLWRDVNHDGVSQPAELMPVVASPVRAISLSYHWSGRRDYWGNTFRYQAIAWVGNDRASTKGRPIYDIFFVAVP